MREPQFSRPGVLPRCAPSRTLQRCSPGRAAFCTTWPRGSVLQHPTPWLATAQVARIAIESKEGKRTTLDLLKSDVFWSVRSIILACVVLGATCRHLLHGFTLELLRPEEVLK